MGEKLPPPPNRSYIRVVLHQPRGSITYCSLFNRYLPLNLHFNPIPKPRLTPVQHQHLTSTGNYYATSHSSAASAMPALRSTPTAIARAAIGLGVAQHQLQSQASPSPAVRRVTPVGHTPRASGFPAQHRAGSASCPVSARNLLCSVGDSSVHDGTFPSRCSVKGQSTRLTWPPPAELSTPTYTNYVG